MFSGDQSNDFHVYIFDRFEGTIVVSSMRCYCWWNVGLSELGLFHAVYSQYREERQRECSSMMKSPLPAWHLNRYCGLLSETACTQGGQLSSLLPQTGILSTWQTSKSGVTLKSHAVIKKVCTSVTTTMLSFSFFPSFASLRKGWGRLQIWLLEKRTFFQWGCYTDLRV